MLRMMDTRCTLKDGREMRIFSDNVNNKTMHLYPEEKAATFDVEFDTAQVVPYDEIASVEHYTGVRMTPEKHAETYPK